MDPIYAMSEHGNRESKLLSARKAGDTALQGNSVAWLASGRGPRIVFAPEGLSDITGGAVAAPAVAGETPAPAPANPVNPEPIAKVERPEWLPENLWDGDKGFKKDDFDALVASKAERDSALASVPEKPDGYAVKLPVDFKLPDGTQLPEGQSAIDTDDPRVIALRDLAHSEKWTQPQFEKVLAFGVNMDIGSEKQLQAELNKEVEKLGSRGVERVKAVTSWLSAKLGAENAQTLHHMMYTAKQIESFERLMGLFQGDVRGNPGAGRDAKPTEMSDEDYEKMSPTQKINYARSAQTGR